MSTLRLRKLADATATRIIKSGGFLLIVIILGMMGFIFYQTLPLWYGARIEPETALTLERPSAERAFLAVGTDDQRRLMYGVADDGQVYFKLLSGERKNLKTLTLPLEAGESISVVTSSLYPNRLAAGTTLGRAILFSFDFKTIEEDDKVSILPLLRFETFLLDSAERKILLLRYATEGTLRLAGLPELSSELVVAEKRDDGGLQTRRWPLHENPLSLAVNSHDDRVVVGFADGTIRFYGPDASSEGIKVSDSGIAALEYLIGDVTLIVGDEKGAVAGWMQVRDKGLTKIRDFGRRADAITRLTASPRNKCFVATDRSGTFGLYHSTSDRLLADVNAPVGKISSLSLSPKADGLVLHTEEGLFKSFHLANDHPEVSWNTLFSKVWYESYDKPTYTWQSSGGTDDFEPKLSMIPLIFGTLKATLYAMLFAIPLAVLGALYTSQFAHPGIRSVIKPTVEIMAALPSVVIGFIAGLWLAPLLRNVLVESVMIFLLSPVIIVLLVWLFNRLPASLTGPFRHGYEVVLMIPAVILAVVVSGLIGGWIDSIFIGGDVPHWLYSTFDIRYDQRNSIVIGIAMAFATMPIIFTITEDSLSSVPQHLTSASLALGASRWQTAMKVVLPAASAGIFSAIMIGFGRAVGETMIVLMATGNTPIMDWSIFNGMRTLSANIAVEIPEAPHGGSLYRTLFFSGLILFIMTFFINTLAELIRQRLRKKYASM